ncbi:MAG: PrpF domain-containing protein [Dongiaceae bacterium]
MPQIGIPAVFYRGGTSKGLFFRREDLPADPARRDALLLAALGSPDPYGRQLDGMGGGVSSLSKVMLVERSRRPGIDLDYTFGQVAVDEPVIDWTSNCGNLTSAIAAFGIETGLVAVAGATAEVALFNTNTSKTILATLPLAADGKPATRGDCAIAGVAGSGAPVALEFVAPGGAVTRGLLPTGRPLDRLEVPGLGAIEASIVDASNPVVFVRAAALGRHATESPAALAADRALLDRLEAIRRAAAVAAGLAADAEEAGRRWRSSPKVAMVGPPADSVIATGATLPAGAVDLAVRMISMGKPHAALPLTGGLCTAAAARIPGTVVAEAAAGAEAGRLRIGHPSGVLEADARIVRAGAGWHCEGATVLRTCRKLMQGQVFVPAALAGSREGETG